VLIVGEPDDLALMQELAIAVGKKGAAPILRVESAALSARWMKEVPATSDAAVAALERKLVPVVDVIIGIDRRDAAVFATIPTERSQAYRDAFKGIDGERMKRGTRSVSLGNGLFPTKATARDVGASEGELKKLFDAGLATDYQALAKTGEAVKAALAPGKEVVITTKAGTNLKLKVGKKPVVVSDGVITADEAKPGSPSLLTWLPAGEAYALVETGSAEGKVVFPRATWEGEDVKDLAIEVKAGKITALTAKPGKAFDRLKAAYDAAGAGKEALTIFDVGLNPDLAKGKRVLNFVPAGNVSIFWGGDEWAGGTNAATYGYGGFLTDATVQVDGKNVVENGALKIAAP